MRQMAVITPYADFTFEVAGKTAKSSFKMRVSLDRGGGGGNNGGGGGVSCPCMC